MEEDIYKIFIQHRILARIYKELLQITDTDSPGDKWAKDRNRHFTLGQQTNDKVAQRHRSTAKCKLNSQRTILARHLSGGLLLVAV